MTPPVLVGVDGSPESTAAAHWAAEEARRRGAALRLVHVWPWLTDGRAAFADPDDLPVAAQRMLAGTAEEVREGHPGVAVHTDVVLDAAVDGLVAAAEDAGLLVVGSRGLGGFAGLLVGSVSMAVAARSAAPVVVVRPGRPARPAEPHRDRAQAASETRPEAVPETVPDVVVGVDAGAPGDAVLAFAFQEAALRGARLRAVHGWELPPAFAVVGFLPSGSEMALLQAGEEKALAAALSAHRERHPDTEVVEQARLGAARTLVEESVGAGLVVVGRRRRPHDFGPRLGRVAHAVLHHAHAPVAVVPHD
ncbi:universal stress protein [Kitasatospora sp. NPDC058201]|uniref:universal stress protein n=1 Tax=Streptomycetaceae TaxID=2062 RepID=UPI002E78825B|nr:universal stress protein [Streptomyces sp. BE303]MED7948472.1 universal stress protein [Streptomyces sp. BE303]